MQRWAGAAFAVFLVAACDGGGGGTARSDTTPLTADVADVAEAPASDADTAPPDVLAPPFDVEILEHVLDVARSGLATGAFDPPALVHGRIPVAPAYAHALSFQMTPMLPPLVRAAPSHGPLVLYTDTFDTIVVSPLDHFFESTVSLTEGAIVYGVHGEIDALPAGFRHRFVVVRGHGVGATIAAWGAAVRAEYGREPTDRYVDVGLSHLGYWTDNGSAYYYRQEPDLDAHETLLAVKADADAQGIPYGYFQLDSWWYFKESEAALASGGLVRWEPKPDLFPEGLTAFQAALGLPLVLHNRWFGKNNAYRDLDEFVDGPQMALPLGRAVFDRFMRDAASWGAVTYEQDWLVPQWDGLPYLREGVDRAADWMARLVGAARDEGLSVQLCMAGAAHLLESVRYANATTVRTSVDHRQALAKEAYWPQFHTVAMVAWALGFLPFKDTFRSSEPWAEQEALVSALSAGMVGPGDAVGTADAVLLARTCRADGLLLKPDRPAIPLDGMFVPHARPFLVSTASVRPGLGTWTYLAGFHLALDHPERRPEDRLQGALLYDGKLEETSHLPRTVTDWEVDLAGELGRPERLVAYDWREGAAEVVEGRLALRPRAHLYDFDYVVLAPILSNDMAFLGETDKFVTVADRRFLAITPEADGIRVRLAGAPGEEVTLRGFDGVAGAVLPGVTVRVGPSGEADAWLPRSLRTPPAGR